MVIENAKYQSAFDNVNTGITCTIDGQTMGIPLDPSNRHYEEIMRQVAAGELTIADAD